MTAPVALHAGDTWEWGENVPDFPPADGWSLVLYIKLRGSAVSAVVIPAVTGPVAVGDATYDYAIQVAPGTTAAYTPGVYDWVYKVEKAGARQTLAGSRYSGSLEVLADIASGTAAQDTRSQAQKALDDAKAWLAALVSGGSSAGAAVLEQRIGDRAVKYASPEEARAGLVRLVNFYEQQVRDEQDAERLARGLPSRARLMVRF